MDRGVWQATVHGITEDSGYDLAIKKQQEVYITEA